MCGAAGRFVARQMVEGQRRGSGRLAVAVGQLAAAAGGGGGDVWRGRGCGGAADEDGTRSSYAKETRCKLDNDELDSN